MKNIRLVKTEEYSGQDVHFFKKNDEYYVMRIQVAGLLGLKKPQRQSSNICNHYPKEFAGEIIHVNLPYEIVQHNMQNALLTMKGVKKLASHIYRKFKVVNNGFIAWLENMAREEQGDTASLTLTRTELREILSVPQNYLRKAYFYIYLHGKGCNNELGTFEFPEERLSNIFESSSSAYFKRLINTLARKGKISKMGNKGSLIHLPALVRKFRGTDNFVIQGRVTEHTFENACAYLLTREELSGFFNGKDFNRVIELKNDLRPVTHNQDNIRNLSETSSKGVVKDVQASWVSVQERLPDCDSSTGLSDIVVCMGSAGNIIFGVYMRPAKVLQGKGWRVSGSYDGVFQQSNQEVKYWMPVPEVKSEEIQKFKIA